VRRSFEAQPVAMTRETAHTSPWAQPETLPWLLRLGTGRPLVRGRAYETAKRAFDVAAVVLSAPVVAPLVALLWLVVKCEYPSASAIFVQMRTGRDGARFRMFKFRTMLPNAEALKATLLARNKLRWPDFKMEDDPRITRVGRFLRRTSLDELPQFLNVLVGDMSLVGPRPTSFPVETYAEWHKKRLAAAPGLTGLWQVIGRGTMEFDERVLLDVEYIERRSLLLDLAILLETLACVAGSRGAY